MMRPNVWIKVELTDGTTIERQMLVENIDMENEIVEAEEQEPPFDMFRNYTSGRVTIKLRGRFADESGGVRC